MGATLWSRKKIQLLIVVCLFVWLTYSILQYKNRIEREVPHLLTRPVAEAQTPTILPEKNEDKIKIVILWTPFFSQHNYVLPLERYSCPELRCEFISNRSLIRSADAVMFHARDTDPYDLPQDRFPHQRWILLHHEAPPNTPPYLFEKLNGLMNWTVTYRTDSDVVLTPRYRKRDKQLPDAVHVNTNKTRLVAWFVSNCKTASKREDFVLELRKSVTIDVFGACGPYVCHPKMSQKCYQTIGREYYFYLSLENAICKDYITEKLFNLLDYDIVPLVFGGVEQDKFLPPNSYINVFDFKSTAALGQYLIRLSKDEAAYSKYFQWRQSYELEPYQHYACQICSKLHSEQEPAKTWNKLNQWWYDESKCRSWTPAEDDERR